MTDIEPEEVVDEDPRVKRMVARMRLFVVLSTGVMAIGFFTVISVIIWRIVKADEMAAPANVDEPREWSVPAGSRIIATAADAGRVFVTAEDAQGRRVVHVLDAARLTPIGRIDERGAEPGEAQTTP